MTLNRSLWCSEAQSNVLVPSSSTLSDAGFRLRLGVQEDVRLLLERALRLHGEFGGHNCGALVEVAVVESRSVFGGWRFEAIFARLVCAPRDGEQSSPR